MRPRVHFASAVATAVVFLGLAPIGPIALAGPQIGSGVELGVSESSLGEESRFAFHGGVRGDLLFLRRRESDVGVGLFASTSTLAFDSYSVGGGAECLIPVSSWVSVVASAGADVRRSRVERFEPGATLGLFAGPRGFNYDGPYSLGFGLFARTHLGLGEHAGREVVGGLQLDLFVVAAPWIFLWNALKP